MMILIYVQTLIFFFKKYYFLFFSKTDFNMSISTRKSLRHDVKPFSTFIKKASVSPTTRIITFENIPDFLEVKEVKNITVNKYKLHFPFIAEVNRVEVLPLNPQKNSKKIQGKTNYGTLYYTIEVKKKYIFIHLLLLHTYNMIRFI